MKRLRIIGTGSAVPEKIVTNADFEKTLDTSDEWIRTRTGISERRVSSPGESSSVLAVKAARAALGAAGVKPEDIDTIIAATVTPDMIMPSAACIVQSELGAKNAYAFDLSAACAGFIYGLQVAWGQALATGARTILFVGADTLTKYCDYSERTVSILFGDGAGAVVLQAEEAGDDEGLLGVKLYSDGSLWKTLYVPHSGSAQPDSRDEQGKRANFIKMDGREIFRHAVRDMTDACLKVLEASGKRPEDVRWLIPHQANARIVTAVAERMKFPEEKVFLNLQKYGNTSAGSIPIALDECVRAGLVKKGDLLLLTAFGAGVTWGSALLRW